jgi:hypothetical protein
MNSCFVTPNASTSVWTPIGSVVLYTRKVHYPKKGRFLSSVFSLLTKWKSDVTSGHLGKWDQFPLWLVAEPKYAAWEGCDGECVCLWSIQVILHGQHGRVLNTHLYGSSVQQLSIVLLHIRNNSTKILNYSWCTVTETSRSMLLMSLFYQYSCCSHLERRASVNRCFTSLSLPSTVGGAPWRGDQPAARPLHTQDNTNTE